MNRPQQSSVLLRSHSLHPLLKAAGAICALMVVPGATASYVSEVQTDNPVAWFRLNETSGTSFTNSGAQSGTGMTSVNNPTLGVASYNPAQMGTAVGCDGSNQYLTTASAAGNAFLGQKTSGYTVEAWVYLNNGWNAMGGVYAEYNYYGMDGNSYLAITADRKMSATGITLTDTLDTGKWYYLTVRGYAGGGWTESHLYVNGVYQTGDAYKGRFDGTGNDASAIGILSNYVVDHGVLQNPFNGVIDEVAVYDTQLSDERILAHYNAGLPVPEPSMLAVLGFGLGALLAARQRRG